MAVAANTHAVSPLFIVINHTPPVDRLNGECQLRVSVVGEDDYAHITIRALSLQTCEQIRRLTRSLWITR